MLELFHLHQIWLAEVADVNDVGFEQLIDRRKRTALDIHRRNHPVLDAGETMRHKVLPAQLQLELAERWLPFVERHEGNLRLDRDRTLELLRAIANHRQ